MSSEPVELDFDPLFAGITRPAMIFGASFEFAILNGMIAAMVFLATGKPWYILVVIPGHAFGYLMCMHEPRRFGILFKWLHTVAKCRNRMFWGKSTYVPI